MSENGSGRPRRSTRNSSLTCGSGSALSSSKSSTVSSTPNPYKKPTYLANRTSASTEATGVVTPTTTPSSGRGRGRGRGRPGSARGGGNSATPTTTGASRGRNSRPECVATRVESRRSTAGSNVSSAKKKKRGGYNSQDYHYGSDFESDQAESEPEQGSDYDSASLEDTTQLDERGDSDSDMSEISTLKLFRLPSPPVPVWMDSDKKVEELDLPKSSDDLLLQRDLVMKAVAIYEPLRRFHQLVRLSPFRFEDFCAALGSDEQSSLLAEIHMQLLKTILREEEANGTVFGPNEVKDSVQAVLYFIDNLTWPESLRSFIESDPSWHEIYEAISSVEYPFCGPEVRIKILSWMVDMFLATNSVREALLSEGNILHEDHCRSCNRLGELICCETCPAVYHLQCITPPLKDDEDPPDDWKCPVCIKHRLSGIVDCASELEKAGLLIRHEKLGYDRHGRKYWFLVRRILVESEDGTEVWYYSTPLQVEELLYRLDEEMYEADLVDNIRTYKEEIVRQMEITEKITDNMKTAHRKTYIEAENTFLKKIHEQREEALIKEQLDKERAEEEAREAKRIEEEKKAQEEEEVRAKEEAERKRIREERLQRRNRNKFVDPNIPVTDISENDTRDLNHCDDEQLSPQSQQTEIKEEPGQDGEEEGENIEEDEKTQPPQEDKPSEEQSPSENASQPSKEVKLSSEIRSNSEEETQLIPVDEKPTKEETDDQVHKHDVKTEEEIEKSEEGKKVIAVITKIVETTNKGKEEVSVKTETVKIEDASGEVSSASRLNNDGKRKSRALLLDWDTDERMTRLKATGLYKLGQEGNFRNYVNVYSGDPLSLSKTQHGEERDRKRHMSHKFSLTTASECKWSGNQNGFRSNMVGTLRTTLLHMEGAFPVTLMHVNWPALRKAWVSAVSACVNSKDFSKAMVALAACLRPACYNPVWSETMGHVKLIRTSAVDREERKKAEKRDKKEREEEEDRLRILPQFVKYTIPIKHNVFKQKGEEYRLHGHWGWIWMSKLRRCKPQDFRKLGLLGGPFKHVIQVKNEQGKVKTILIDPTVFDKLMAKRSQSQKTTPTASPMKTAGGSESLQLATSSSAPPAPMDALPAPSSPSSSERKDSTDKLAESMVVDKTDDEICDYKDSDEKPGKDEKLVVVKEESKGEKIKMEEEVEEKAERGESPDDESAKDTSAKARNAEPSSKVENEAMDVDTIPSETAKSKDVVAEDEVKVEEEIEKHTESALAIAPALSSSAAEGEVKTEVKVEKMEESVGESSQAVVLASSSQSGSTVTVGADEKPLANAEDIPRNADDIPRNTEDVPRNTEDVPRNAEDVPRNAEDVPRNAEDVPRNAEDIPRNAEDIPRNAEDIPRNALSGVGRKFKTELVNVSLGIVSANRILYPKIAHRSPVLDGLLTRRMKLQSLEEKELLETYGAEMLQKANKRLNTKANEEDADSSEDVEEEILDESFPIAGIYKYQCYSYMCQSAAAEFNIQRKKKKEDGGGVKVREYECKCYSPMCRLKYFVQETNRRKEEKIKQIEKEKLDKIVKEIKEKKMFTQTDSSSKVYLKKLPDQIKKKRTQVKYPVTSTFKSAVSKEPSILILPQYELRKLGRTAGRSFNPTGFAPAPKAGSWGWTYPCGRPFFKTAWQFKAVNASTLAAAAMQLRILWGSIRWDDIQMKMPNSDGKNLITTDMEVITTEILKHRIIGRFMERVQYLRKKTVVPIDAPKTIRAKSRDSTEITPSRSGLRKRKRAESPDKTDPVVSEEWVDEDKVDLWEIKYYGEKQDKKTEPPKPPVLASTRLKSGVALKQPEKFDPSPAEKEAKPEKTVSAVKSAELMREQLETELKMQRAVHLSKRDNHPKTSNPTNKVPTPTASQQLQQQQAAAGLPTNPRSGNATGGQKKIFVSKTSTGGVATTTAETAAVPNPVILSRKPANTPATKQYQPAVNSPANNTVAVQQQQQQQPQTPQQMPTQKITVFRTPDGKLQVKGLLPGQSVYQTPDGKICLAGTPMRPPQQQQQVVQQPPQQQQTQTIVIQGQPGQLQQTATPGVIHVQGNPNNPMVITSSSASQQLQQQVTHVANQPLINISNPAMRTVITSAAATNPNLLKYPTTTAIQQQQQQQTQLIHTYATPSKSARKSNPKGPSAVTSATASPTTSAVAAPAAIAPAGGTTTPATISGTINAQGQLVFTSARGTHVISGNQVAQLSQQGQIVITSQQAGNIQQGSTVVMTSGGQFTVASPGGNNASMVSIANSALQQQQGVIHTTTSGGQTQLALSQQQQQGVLQTSQAVNASGLSAIQLGGAGGGGSRVIVQDGNKTLLLHGSGMGNITPQQLQQIIQMQAAKKMQPLAKQQQQGGAVVQQIIQQPQQQQTTMQIIQQPGQPMQLITQTPGGQQQQQQQIVIQQSPGGGHQLASLGGQPLLVKKIVKGGTPSAAGSKPGASQTNIVQIAGPGGATAAQLQQLLAQGKNVIRVDPKSGGVAMTPAALLQLQQQQRIQPAPPVGVTTVTRTPGLPISIVSPSKAKMVPTSIFQPPGSPVAIVVSSAGVRQISSAPTSVIQTIAGQQLQQQSIVSGGAIRPSSGMPMIGAAASATQVVSAVPGPQVVSTVSRTSIGQQQIRPHSPMTTAGIIQGNKLITSAGIVNKPMTSLQGPSVMQQQSTLASPTRPTTITIPPPQLSHQVQLQTPLSPAKSPTKGPTSRITAQVVQTPQGPKVIVSGLKPGELSPLQWAQLQDQLQRQVLQQQLISQNKGQGVQPGAPSPSKFLIQPGIASPVHSSVSQSSVSDGSNPSPMVTVASPASIVPASPSGVSPTILQSFKNLAYTSETVSSSPSPTMVHTPPTTTILKAVSSSPKAVSNQIVLTAGPSPPKIPKLSADSQQGIMLPVTGEPQGLQSTGSSSSSSQVIGHKSVPILISEPTPQLPTPPPPAPKPHTPSKSHHPVKTPPNSANIDAAIAAVASNYDAPVIVPVKPPKKSQSNKGKGGGKGPGILKNILQKDEQPIGIQQVFALKSLPPPPKQTKEAPPKSPPKKKPKKQQLKTPAPPPPPLLTPVEPSSVPQPIEQDVVISTTESHEVTLETVTSRGSPSKGKDGPRFVLSQDLISQSMTKQVETATGSMTFFAGQKSPPHGSPAAGMSPPRQAALMTGHSPVSISTAPTTTLLHSPPLMHKVSPPPAKASSGGGSSRRKSPVKSKNNTSIVPVKVTSPAKSEAMFLTQQTQPSSKISMSTLVPPKLVTNLHKHKELLKKDICKKRGILEKELYLDIQKEIAEEIGKHTSEKKDTGSHEPTPKSGKKRKMSEPKSSPPGTKEPERDGGVGAGKGRKGSLTSSTTRSPGGGASGPPGSGPKKAKKKLYCICKTPYDNTKFYVGCDVCSNWFHGDCIGITEAMSQCLSEYVCDSCQDESNKLYCLCRQPYDEAQFYICCDTCQDWFHGRCVGILQVEGSAIDEYTCPNCDPNSNLNHANLKDLSDQDYTLISKLLKQLQTHKNAWPFREPVDPAEAPNYYKVIKEPMDLQTIEFRVEQKVYNRLKDFIGDITKVFDNCRYYNPGESPFFKSANTLEAFFAQKLAILRNTIVKHNGK